MIRAVDKEGKTVDFLLTAKRDASAAGRFFDTAMRYNDVPAMVTMDKSVANRAAFEQLNMKREIKITSQQVKYLGLVKKQAGELATPGAQST